MRERETYCGLDTRWMVVYRGVYMYYWRYVKEGNDSLLQKDPTSCGD